MGLDGTTHTVEHDGFSVTSTDSEEAIKSALGVDAVKEAAKPASDTLTDDAAESDELETAEGDSAAKPPVKQADKLVVEQPRNADGTFTRKQWQKSVDRLTYQAREAERERDALRAEVAALKAPKAVEQPAEDLSTTFPEWEPWDAKNPNKGYDAYLRAAARHEATETAKAVVAAERAAWQKERDTETSQRQTMTVLQKLDHLGTTAHTDFRDVMTALHEQQLSFAPHLAGIIAEELDGDAPLGHELAYHLATHPDDLRRLNALPPLTAARHVQKILDTFVPATRGSGTERPAVSQAHPPTKPIGAGPSADLTDDPDDNEPFEKFVERENAKDRKAGRLR